MLTSHQNITIHQEMRDQYNEALRKSKNNVLLTTKREISTTQSNLTIQIADKEYQKITNDHEKLAYIEKFYNKLTQLPILLSIENYTAQSNRNHGYKALPFMIFAYENMTTLVAATIYQKLNDIPSVSRTFTYSDTTTKENFESLADLPITKFGMVHNQKLSTHYLRHNDTTIKIYYGVNSFCPKRDIKFISIPYVDLMFLNKITQWTLTTAEHFTDFFQTVMDTTAFTFRITSNGV